MAERAIFLRAVSGDIGTVAAFREGDFEGGDRIAVFLGPEEGEAFEREMRGRLAAGFVGRALRLPGGK